MNHAAPGMSDPNPVTLFHVYTAVLMGLAGSAYRSLTASALETPGRSDPEQLHSLAAHLSFANDLLQDHAALINAASAGNTPILPVGMYTLWLASNQVERYVAIRDGMLNAAPRIIQECASLGRLTVSPALIPLVEKELKVIQASARGVFSMNTFGQAIGVIRTGFSSALYVLDLVMREETRHAPPAEAQ